LTYDIVSIGNINIDLSFYFEKMPTKDREEFSKDFIITHGGSAANFAFAASRLGLRVSMLGCVGDDYFGTEGLLELKRVGVDCGNVKRIAGKRTGVVCVLVDEHGERKMIAYRGANEELISAVNEKIPDSNIVHMSNVDKRVLSEVLKTDIRGYISLDPGGGAKKLGIDLLEGLDVLLLNEQECRDLTKLPFREGVELLAKKVDIVIIKLGKDGAFLATGSQRLLQKPFTVSVMDTTGAGDSFDAGFLFGLIEGKDMATCLRLGQAVAAMKIGGKGARSNLPSRVKLIEFMEKNQL
jgi:ribokinase